MDRFEAAVREFDRENARDPTLLVVDGAPRPRELVDAERLSRWIGRLAPEASEPLRLAARCQHLRRWEIPRSRYEAGRTGYLLWRRELARFHADRAEEVLRRVGYDDATVDRVRSIVQKKALKQDPDVQTMEDALCLSFLEHELDEFATKHPPEKVVDILRKTWRKMGDEGRRHALALPFSAPVRALVDEALAGADPGIHRL
jgi:hypothetical protein